MIKHYRDEKQNKIKNKKPLLIFDFDGTLVDTADLIFDIGKIYYPELTKEKVRVLFDFNVFEAIWKLFNIDTLLHMISFDSHEFFNEYQRRLKKKHFHAGMKILLKNLAKNFNLAIASSMQSRVIKKYFIKNNISFFKTIIGSDSHFSKEKNIETLIKQYKADPLKTLLITDTLGDIKSATKANIKSLAVNWGIHGMRRLRRGRPFAIVSTVSQLHNKINKFFGK